MKKNPLRFCSIILSGFHEQYLCCFNFHLFKSFKKQVLIPVFISTKILTSFSCFYISSLGVTWMFTWPVPISATRNSKSLNFYLWDLNHLTWIMFKNKYHTFILVKKKKNKFNKIYSTVWKFHKNLFFYIFFNKLKLDLIKKFFIIVKAII